LKRPRNVKPISIKVDEGKSAEAVKETAESEKALKKKREASQKAFNEAQAERLRVSNQWRRGGP
jgi:hypothetical protein